ncbi:MAG TPA: hypothetical protein VKM55_25930 [Candidatus Lokiarchaeia archaeon]|nr:hypothetical protein [Candidatus Lokiarchaeia archaeon]
MKVRKQDVIKGIARNAKAGAVVVPTNGSPIYIEHLESWPDDVLGCEIEAKGTLRAKKIIPDPVVDEEGAISQGAAGEQDVLENAQWKNYKSRQFSK